MIIADDLDKVQERLHDNGTLWTRAELLRWYVDGYRDLLARSAAVSRWLPMDIPARHSYALSYAWESAYASGGTWWLPMATGYGGTYQVTATWEVEHSDGATPSAALVAIMHQWERTHTTETDRHFRFALPKDHERIRRIEWSDRVLLPVAVRELDELDDSWMRTVGEPQWWTTGVGQVNSFELYEITTVYQQAYELINGMQGLPREFSGSRSYAIEVDPYNVSNSYAYAAQGDADAITSEAVPWLSGMGSRFTREATDKTLGFPLFVWEKQQLDGATVATQTTGGTLGMFPWEAELGASAISFGLGGIRSITSPDRQYLALAAEPASAPLLGGIRDWRSSTDNVMALEVVLPPVDLTESDAPVLIPSPTQKYLRYYTLSRAFGREGEGQRLDVAQHYDQRFQRGVNLFRRFGDSAHADRTFRRQDERAARARPLRVRLPSEFESVW